MPVGANFGHDPRKGLDLNLIDPVKLKRLVLVGDLNIAKLRKRDSKDEKTLRNLGLTEISKYEMTYKAKTGYKSAPDCVYSSCPVESDLIFIDGIEHGAISAIICLDNKPKSEKRPVIKENYEYNTEGVIIKIQKQPNSLAKPTTQFFRKGMTILEPKTGLENHQPKPKKLDPADIVKTKQNRESVSNDSFYSFAEKTLFPPSEPKEGRRKLFYVKIGKKPE